MKISGGGGRVQWRNTGLLGSDQPLKDLNLISKATLNVLEPGSRREITCVEEEQLRVCHEHIGFTQEVARLRSGKYIGAVRELCCSYPQAAARAQLADNEPPARSQARCQPR